MSHHQLDIAYSMHIDYVNITQERIKNKKNNTHKTNNHQPNQKHRTPLDVS